MKYEWKKADKSIYLPKNKPEIIELPHMKYFMLKGKGNPNDSEFGEVIEALYSVSYGVRMSHKSGTAPDGYYEYTVSIGRYMGFRRRGQRARDSR